MKKYLIFVLIVMLFVGCSKKRNITLLNSSDFETVIDGKRVSLYTLKSGFLTMQVTNYGGRVVSLWVPDNSGSYDDVVLGYENINRYVNNEGERFLGAAVGRCANRIEGGSFSIDGKMFETFKNDNGNTLHGGEFGIDRIVWDVDSVTENAIFFHTVLADGKDGFPGNLDIRMSYVLTPENEFRVEYFATTDAPTLCNLSHHSFFNLKGEGNGDVLDHELTINSQFITVINDRLVPNGNFVAVKGSPMDFSEGKTIGRDIEKYHPQMENAKGYDFNYVINKPIRSMGVAATVIEPNSGRKMIVSTDQPGIQFYSGNFFDGKTNGKKGMPLGYRGGFALETQQFPDAVNHQAFPSVVLRPGETYHHTCIYGFEILPRK